MLRGWEAADLAEGLFDQRAFIVAYPAGGDDYIAPLAAEPLVDGPRVAAQPRVVNAADRADFWLLVHGSIQRGWVSRK